jgi:hypothetical protein
MSEVVTAVSIDTADSELIIRLADREVRIPWERCSPLLAAAPPEQRRRVELSPGGYGIHWPLLDEDISIGRLVG